MSGDPPGRRRGITVLGRGYQVLGAASTAAVLVYMLRPALREEVACRWQGRHLYSILTRARDRVERGG